MVARRRSLTSEERRLWRVAMRDAKPLKPETPVAELAEALPVAAAPSPAAAPRPSAPRMPAAPPLAPDSGLDRRTDERLRRGRLEIQAKLDLHGLTQAEAHAALNGFVQRSRSTGRRSVLIITGKGPVGEGGILRRAVPRWLHEPPLREAVLAIRPAQPKDGGEGALYVLLRKPHRGRQPGGAA